MHGIRAVSTFLILCFLSQEVGWTALAQDAGSPATRINQSTFSLPGEVALIKENENNQSKELIINIRDVHDNFSAQESIVSVLENLIDNYQIQLIGVEGSEGFIDPSLLSAFPDTEIKKKVSEQLMREGKLSAGEFVAVMRGDDVGLYGTDDMELYDQNLTSFKEAVKNGKDNSKLADALTQTIFDLEKNIFSPELQKIATNGVLAVNGGISFSSRWKTIAQIADDYKISYESYENISKLLKCIDLEKQIDFKSTNEERKNLMDALAKKMAKEDLDKLILESVHYKLGRISQASFSSYILEVAKTQKADLSAYPNLNLYSEYMASYEAIDIDLLKDEVARLEEAIREKVYRNDDERRLFELHKKAGIIKDLFDLKLTPSGIAFYENNKQAFNAKEFKESISILAKKYKVAADTSNLDNLFARIPNVVRFYTVAEARNEALLNRMIQVMRSRNQTVGCLITGGFHSKGITDLMRSNQISHIVILPRFNKDAKRPYLTIITNQENSYKDFVKSQTVYEARLKFAAYLFAQAAYKIVLANPGMALDKLNILIQKETEQTKVLYANNFRSNQKKNENLLPSADLYPKGLKLPLMESKTTLKGTKQLAMKDSYIAPTSNLGGSVFLVGTMGVLEVGANGEATFVETFPSENLEVKVDVSSNGQMNMAEPGPLAKPQASSVQSEAPAVTESADTAKILSEIIDQVGTSDVSKIARMANRKGLHVSEADIQKAVQEKTAEASAAKAQAEKQAAEAEKAQAVEANKTSAEKLHEAQEQFDRAEEELQKARENDRPRFGRFRQFFNQMIDAARALGRVSVSKDEHETKKRALEESRKVSKAEIDDLVRQGRARVDTKKDVSDLKEGDVVIIDGQAYVVDKVGQDRNGRWVAYDHGGQPILWGQVFESVQLSEEAPVAEKDAMEKYKALQAAKEEAAQSKKAEAEKQTKESGQASQFKADQVRSEYNNEYSRLNMKIRQAQTSEELDAIQSEFEALIEKAKNDPALSTDWIRDALNAPFYNKAMKLMDMQRSKLKAQAQKAQAEKQAAEAEKVQVEKAETAKQAAEVAKQAAEAEKAQAEKQAAEAEKVQAEKAEAAKQAAEVAKQAAEAEKAQAEKQAAEAKKSQAEAIQSELDKIDAQIKEAAAEITSAQSESKKFNQKLTEFLAKRDQILKELQALAAEKEEAKKASEGTQKALDAKKSEKEKLDKRQENYEQKVRLETQLKELSKQQKDTSATPIEEKAERLKDLDQKIAEYKAQGKDTTNLERMKKALESSSTYEEYRQNMAGTDVDQWNKDYRKAAMEFHPDRNPGDSSAKGLLQLNLKAYEAFEKQNSKLSANEIKDQISQKKAELRKIRTELGLSAESPKSGADVTKESKEQKKDLAQIRDGLKKINEETRPLKQNAETAADKVSAIERQESAKQKELEDNLSRAKETQNQKSAADQKAAEATQKINALNTQKKALQIKASEAKAPGTQKAAPETQKAEEPAVLTGGPRLRAMKKQYLSLRKQREATTDKEAARQMDQELARMEAQITQLEKQENLLSSDKYKGKEELLKNSIFIFNRMNDWRNLSVASRKEGSDAAVLNMTDQKGFDKTSDKDKKAERILQDMDAAEESGVDKKFLEDLSKDMGLSEDIDFDKYRNQLRAYRKIWCPNGKCQEINSAEIQNFLDQSVQVFGEFATIANLFEKAQALHQESLNSKDEATKGSLLEKANDLLKQAEERQEKFQEFFNKSGLEDGADIFRELTQQRLGKTLTAEEADLLRQNQSNQINLKLEISQRIETAKNGISPDLKTDFKKREEIRQSVVLRQTQDRITQIQNRLEKLSGTLKDLESRMTDNPSNEDIKIYLNAEQEFLDAKKDFEKLGLDQGFDYFAQVQQMGTAEISASEKEKLREIYDTAQQNILQMLNAVESARAAVPNTFKQAAQQRAIQLQSPSLAKVLARQKDLLSRYETAKNRLEAAKALSKEALAKKDNALLDRSIDEYNQADLLMKQLAGQIQSYGLAESFDYYISSVEKEFRTKFTDAQRKELQRIYENAVADLKNYEAKVAELKTNFNSDFTRRAAAALNPRLNPKTPFSGSPGISDSAKERLAVKKLDPRFASQVRTRIQNGGYANRWTERFQNAKASLAGKFFAAGALAAGESHTSDKEAVVQDLGVNLDSAEIQDLRADIEAQLASHPDAAELNDPSSEKIAEIQINFNGTAMKFLARNVKGSVLVASSYMLSSLGLSAQEYYDFMSLGMAIEDTNLAGLKTGVANPYLVLGLEKSSHLFEDHKANGVIGVNVTALKAGQTKLSESQKILMVMGMMHELYHEARPDLEQSEDLLAGFEAERLAMDIELSLIMADALGIEASQYLNEVQGIFKNNEAIYPEALQEVFETLVEAGYVKAPEAILLKQETKNLTSIDPETLRKINLLNAAIDKNNLDQVGHLLEQLEDEKGELKKTGNEQVDQQLARTKDTYWAKLVQESTGNVKLAAAFKPVGATEHKIKIKGREIEVSELMRFVAQYDIFNRISISKFLDIATLRNSEADPQFKIFGQTFQKKDISLDAQKFALSALHAKDDRFYKAIQNLVQTYLSPSQAQKGKYEVVGDRLIVRGLVTAKASFGLDFAREYLNPGLNQAYLNPQELLKLRGNKKQIEVWHAEAVQRIESLEKAEVLDAVYADNLKQNLQIAYDLLTKGAEHTYYGFGGDLEQFLKEVSKVTADPDAEKLRSIAEEAAGWYEEQINHGTPKDQINFLEKIKELAVKAGIDVKTESVAELLHGRLGLSIDKLREGSAAVRRELELSNFKAEAAKFEKLWTVVFEVNKWASSKFGFTSKTELMQEISKRLGNPNFTITDLAAYGLTVENVLGSTQELMGLRNKAQDNLKTYAKASEEWIFMQLNSKLSEQTPQLMEEMMQAYVRFQVAGANRFNTAEPSKKLNNQYANSAGTAGDQLIQVVQSSIGKEALRGWNTDVLDKKFEAAKKRIEDRYKAQGIVTEITDSVVYDELNRLFNATRESIEIDLLIRQNLGNAADLSLDQVFDEETRVLKAGLGSEFADKSADEVNSAIKSKLAKGETLDQGRLRTFKDGLNQLGITSSVSASQIDQVYLQSQEQGDVSVASWLREKFKNNKDKMDEFNRIDGLITEILNSSNPSELSIDLSQFNKNPESILYYTEKLFDSSIKKNNNGQGSIKSDQRYLFSSFLGQLRSVEMEAGGGKTDAALFFLQVAGMLYPDASRLLIVNSSDAAAKFVNGKGPTGPRKDFAKLFGANLVDGSALQAGSASGGYSGKTGFVDAVKDKRNIIIIDFTALGHLHNDSIEVVNAVKQFNVIVVDEAHLPVTSQQAYIVGGEEVPYADTAQGRARLDAWKKFYNRLFADASSPLRFAPTEGKINESDAVPTVFVPTTKEEIKEGKRPRYNKAALRLFEEIMREYGQEIKDGEFLQFVSGISQVRAGQEGEPNGYATRDGKVFPVAQNGAVSWNSRISDVNYKIGIAIEHDAKLISQGISEESAEFQKKRIDLNLIGKAKTQNYTSLLQIFAKNKAIIVGMTATASGKEALINAGIGASEGGFVKITASKYTEEAFKPIDKDLSDFTEQDILDLDLSKIKNLKDLQAMSPKVWKFATQLMETVDERRVDINGKAIKPKSVLVASTNGAVRQKLSQLLEKMLGDRAASQLETVDAVTDNELINQIADYAGPGTDKSEKDAKGYSKFGPKIIIINEQAFTGVDFRGVMDLHILGGENFTEDALAQLTYRSGRTTLSRNGDFVDLKTGRYRTDRYLYLNSQKADKQLSEWKNNQKFIEKMRELMLPNWDGMAGDAEGAKLIDLLIKDGVDAISKQDKLKLIIKIRNAVERSNAIEFAMSDTMRGRMIINELRGRKDRLEEKLANPIISEKEKAIIKQELKLISEAFEDVINHDSRGSGLGTSNLETQSGYERASAVFESVRRESLDVFSRLSEKLSTLGSASTMKDSIDALVDQYMDISFERTKPAKGNDSFAKAKSIQDVLAVAKSLANLMLPKVEGSRQPIIEVESHTVNEALTEIKADTKQADKLKDLLNNERYVEFKDGLATENLTLAGRSFLGAYRLIAVSDDDDENFKPLREFIARNQALRADHVTASFRTVVVDSDDAADITGILFSSGILESQNGALEDTLKALKNLNDLARTEIKLNQNLPFSSAELRIIATEKFDTDLKIHDLLLNKGIPRREISEAMAKVYAIAAKTAQKSLRTDAGRNYESRAKRVMALASEEDASKYKRLHFLKISGQAERDRTQELKNLQNISKKAAILNEITNQNILNPKNKNQKADLLKFVIGPLGETPKMSEFLNAVIAGESDKIEKILFELREEQEKAGREVALQLPKTKDAKEKEALNKKISENQDSVLRAETLAAYQIFKIQSASEEEIVRKKAVADFQNFIYQTDREFKDTRLEEEIGKSVETLQKTGQNFSSSVRSKLEKLARRASQKIQAGAKAEADLLEAEIGVKSSTDYAARILSSQDIKEAFDADEFLGINYASFVKSEEQQIQLKNYVKSNIIDNPEVKSAALKKSAEEFLKAVNDGDMNAMRTHQADLLRFYSRQAMTQLSPSEREYLKQQKTRMKRMTDALLALKTSSNKKLDDIRNIVAQMESAGKSAAGAAPSASLLSALNSYLKQEIDLNVLTHILSEGLESANPELLQSFAKALIEGKKDEADKIMNLIKAGYKDDEIAAEKADFVLEKMSQVLTLFSNVRSKNPDKDHIDLADFLAHWASIKEDYKAVNKFSSAMNYIYEKKGDFEEDQNLNAGMPSLRFDTVEEREPDPKKSSFYAVNLKKVISRKENMSSTMTARGGLKVPSIQITTRQIDFLETYHPDLYQRTRNVDGHNLVIGNFSGAGQYVESTLLPQIRGQKRTSTGQMEALIKTLDMPYESTVKSVVQELIHDIFLSHEFQHASESVDEDYKFAEQSIGDWAERAGATLYGQEKSMDIARLARGFMSELGAHLRSAFEKSDGSKAATKAAFFVLYQLNTYLSAPQAQHYKEVSKYIFGELADMVNAKAKSEGREEPIKGSLFDGHNPIDVIDAVRREDPSGEFAQAAMKKLYEKQYEDPSKLFELSIDIATKYHKNWKPDDYKENYEAAINQRVKNLKLSDDILKETSYDAKKIAHKALESIRFQKANPTHLLNEISGDLKTFQDALTGRDKTFEETTKFKDAVSQASVELKKRYEAAMALNGQKPILPFEFPDLTKKVIAIRKDKWKELKVYVPGPGGQLQLRQVDENVTAIQVFGADVILVPAEENWTPNQLLGLMLHEMGHLVGVDIVDHDLREGITEWRGRQMLKELKGDEALEEYLQLSKSGEGLYAPQVKAAIQKYAGLDASKIDLARFSGNTSTLGARLSLEEYFDQFDENGILKIGNQIMSISDSLSPQLREAIFNLVNADKSEGQTIVSIGEGQGQFASMFVGKHRVMGTDLSQKNVDLAKQKGVELTKVNEEDKKLPFADASTDTVLLINSLSYFNDYPNILSEVYRILKPGGRVIVSTGGLQSDMNFFKLPPHEQEELVATKRNPLTKDHLENVLEQTGFVSQKMQNVPIAYDLPGTNAHVQAQEEVFSAQKPASGARLAAEPMILAGVVTQDQGILVELAKRFPNTKFAAVRSGGDAGASELQSLDPQGKIPSHILVDISNQLTGSGADLAKLSAAIAPVVDQINLKNFIAAYIYAAGLPDTSISDRTLDGSLQTRLLKAITASLNDARPMDVDYLLSEKPENPNVSSISGIDIASLDAIGALIGGQPSIVKIQAKDEAFVAQQIQALQNYQAARRLEPQASEKAKMELQAMQSQISAYLSGKSKTDAQNILTNHERIAIAQGLENQLLRLLATSYAAQSPYALVLDARKQSGFNSDELLQAMNGLKQKFDKLAQNGISMENFIVVDSEDRERYEALNLGNIIVRSSAENLADLGTLKIKGTDIPLSNIVVMTPDKNAQNVIHGLDLKQPQKNWVFTGSQLEPDKRFTTTLALIALLKRVRENRPVMVAAGSPETSLLLKNSPFAGLFNLIEVSSLNVLGYLDQYKKAIQSILQSA